MLKSPITRLPAILLDFIDCPSGDGLCLWSKCQVKYDAALIDSNSRLFKTRMKKWPLELLSTYFLMLFCLTCNLVPENWNTCFSKGLTYLHQWNQCITTQIHWSRMRVIVWVWPVNFAPQGAHYHADVINLLPLPGIKKGIRALWHSELSLHQLGSQLTVFIPLYTRFPSASDRL